MWRTAVLAAGAFLSAISQSRAEDGIAVGRPKVYDNRSLLLMLDQFSQSLNTVQFVDQKSLAKALGVQQGFQSQDVSTGFNLEVSPAPAAAAPSAAAVATSTTASSSSAAAPSTSKGSGTPAASSSAVTLPDLQTAPAFTPVFGENPSDLLADQVNLTYQVFNLRMLLERSLSDRLINGHTRLQAVLGFNVSLDPPKDSKDCAAIVEVLVTAEDAKGGQVSLVAVMPQEKTYNSSALSQHSTAFGGSAVASLFTVGFTQRRRGQTFYLFRDADTISFERMADLRGKTLTDNELTFGWEFRPVLGRHSVSPGSRQVFAVISIPSIDDPPKLDQDRTSDSDVQVPAHLKVSVRTFWRHYDHSTLTTTDREGFWSSLFRANQLPSPETRDYTNVEVPTTFQSQRDLTPQIEQVSWVAVDKQNAVVSVTGRNFFSGTTVALGGKVYAGQASGLIFKSDQAMQMNTTIGEIANGDAVINGRYGPSIRLELPPGKISGFTIDTVELEKISAGFYNLKATLKALGTDRKLTVEDLPHGLNSLPPVIALNGAPVPNVPVLNNGTNHVVLQVPVPASMVTSLDDVLLIKFPFVGLGWSATYAIHDPCTLLTVTRLQGDPNAALIVTGLSACPANNWRLQLDQTYQEGDSHLTKTGPDVLTLSIPAATLGKYKQMVALFDVEDPGGKQTITRVLPIPDTAPPAPQPKLDPKQAPAPIVQGEAHAVVFSGTDLGGIKSAEFGGKTLEIDAAKDGKTITVFVTQDVTANPGRQDVLLHTSSGSIIAAPLIVAVSPAPITKPKKTSDSTTSPPQEKGGTNQ